MVRGRLALMVGLGLMLGGCAAMQPPETLYFQQSRYGQLRQLMEERVTDMKAAPTSQLLYLCFAYLKTRDYERLAPCVEDLQENVDQGDSDLYVFDFTSAPALMRAEAALDLGNPTEALYHAQLAESQTRATATYKQMRIYALSAVALASALSGDRAGALRWAGELEKIHTGYPDNLMAADKAIGLAKTYMALGEYGLAIAAIEADTANTGFKAFTDLLTGAAMTGDSLFTYWELPKRFILAKARLESGDVAAARTEFDALLAMPQVSENSDLYWLLLYDRGRVARLQGEAGMAVELFSRAVLEVERQRATIHTEANKIGFVGDKQALYGDLVAVLVEQGRFSEAFAYAERGKARALVDLLASRRGFAAAGLSPAEVEALVAEVDEAERQSRLSVYAVNRTEAGRRLARARGVSLQARSRIAALAPEVTSLITVRTPDAPAIQSLLAGDETLVEYFGSDKDLFVFVVTREAIHALRLENEGMAGLVTGFRRALVKPASEAWRESARRLHQRLFAPVERLVTTSNLIIVPHASLHYLPFNALESVQGPLIDRFAIRLLPAAGVLEYLKAGRSAGTGNLLVLGNPDLGDPRLDLPGAEVEAKAIAALEPGARVVLRGQASETLFKKAGAGFRALHLASHGQFDARRPLASGMRLAPDGANDGTLTVGELYELRLDADMVTLSACETGLGKVANGDDVVGLTRGFLYAGTRSIVASLWPVSDKATETLMVAFYRALGRTLGDKAAALRQAQLETRKSFPHPAFWAAFQLTGRGR